MNWKQGLIRLWVLATVLWIVVLGYFAAGVFLKPLPFRDDYQYDVETKEMPWNTDWKKPFYEIIYAPGKGRFPDRFDPVGEEYVKKYDQYVNDGKYIVVEFPDYSRLFLNSEFTQADRTYLSQLFWAQRWSRYFSKVAPWLGSALGIPLVFLIFGFSISWVRRGFANEPSL